MATYASFSYNKVEGPSRPKALVLWLVLIFSLILTLTVAVVGTFGVGLAGILQNPFFSMIRNEVIFGVVSRIEAVVVGVWVLSDFVLVAFLFSLAGETWHLTLGRPTRKQIIPICAVLATALALYLGDSAFSLRTFSNRVLTIINFCMIFFGFPLICLVGKLRKRI